LRPPGPGGQDDGVGTALDERGRGFGVALDDLGLGPETLDQLHEVVGERVVVVDDQDHRFAPSIVEPARSGASGPSTAGSRAAAFALVSASSTSGSESATTPAPVCTCAVPSATITVRIVMQKSRSPANVQ